MRFIVKGQSCIARVRAGFFWLAFSISELWHQRMGAQRDPIVGEETTEKTSEEMTEDGNESDDAYGVLIPGTRLGYGSRAVSVNVPSFRSTF